MSPFNAEIMLKNMTVLLFLFTYMSMVGQPNLKSDLDRLVPELITKAGIPGISLAVIRDDEISYQSAFGVKNVESKAAVDQETIFEAASLTKPVFAYAVCRLVDAGILDLDTPLEHYWSYPDLQPPHLKTKITARMVLTHSTGLPNWRRPRNSEELPINFEPGDRFSYSGEGFVYLSKVVAHLTKMPTHEWVRQMVFEPLGMLHSSLIWTDKLGANSAVPHNKAGETSNKYKPKQANAAASLHTTASDYATFLLALLEGKNLAPTTHRMMLSTQQKVDPKCSQCRSPNSNPSFKEVSWGLGIGLEHTDQDYIWHWGDNGSFKSYVCVSLKSGTGLVYFANSSNGLAIRNQLVEAVLPGVHPAHDWVKYKQIKSKKPTGE